MVALFPAPFHLLLVARDFVRLCSRGFLCYPLLVHILADFYQVKFVAMALQIQCLALFSLVEIDQRIGALIEILRHHVVGYKDSVDFDRRTDLSILHRCWVQSFRFVAFLWSVDKNRFSDRALLKHIKQGVPGLL